MRTFVALDLPEGFVYETGRLARRLARSIEGRFMPPESYHVTLAFLGDVDERGVASALGALDDACRAASPVSVACSGLGTFGRSSDATLWLGLAPSEGLAALAADLRDGLARRGATFDEKPFKPHVTLARRARIGACELDGLPFPSDALATTATVYRSDLGSSGATYKALYTVELGGEMA